MSALKSIVLVVILVFVSVDCQSEVNFFESVKTSLSQKPLIFNATQTRNYNDQLCVRQFEAVLNDMGKLKKRAFQSTYLQFLIKIKFQ